MKQASKILSYILVAVLSSALTLFVSYGIPEESKLQELSDLIDECFIGEANRTEYEDAAASAMVAALGDRWSYYIPASDFQAHTEQMENAYVGIGITISVMSDGTGFEVTKVNEGSPADEAGMLPGDVITGIDGQSCSGMTTEEARNLP